MHVAIQISKINDFIFCPNSIYLHAIYESFQDEIYKQKPQIVGTIKHENIDKGYYSSDTRYLQGIPVFSDKYQIIGKIDIYDSINKSLIDRKYKIKEIYDGYKYQLYAQYFCMMEKGYEVNDLYLHSLSDNKRFKVELPNKSELKKFEKVLDDLVNFDPENMDTNVSKNKCNNCIYNMLCDYAKLT
jgi:CRISPR-associated exonuclease Cas4